MFILEFTSGNMGWLDGPAHFGLKFELVVNRTRTKWLSPNWFATHSGSGYILNSSKGVNPKLKIFYEEKL